MRKYDVEVKFVKGSISEVADSIIFQSNKSVIVRLKNDVEYKGKIVSVDSYMNLIMTDAEELRDGKTVEKFGRVILRGNNVLFIKLENEL